jgi:CHASE2 domain-containing sensor protein
VSALKNLGYVLASILVCTVLFVGGTILTAIGALITFVFTVAAAVVIVALLLKEYFEQPKPDLSKER